MKKALLFLYVVTTVTLFAQQEQKNDTIIQIEEVLLQATRVKDKSPFAHSTIKTEQVQTLNLAQDLPILIDQLPSVVTTSDAGAGVGYTGIRVRGSDATRVNVTLNGIPFNDSESQGTFWVDLPDFISSVEDIQLQRGVGTSTNGAGAFGASLNLKTLAPSKESFAKTTHTFGSFNTRKHNISVGSGMHEGFYAQGRLSTIKSDGYVDRAFADLNSHFLEAGYQSKKTAIKTLIFGGEEQTYQSWYGTPEAVLLGDVVGIEAFIERNYPTEAQTENLRRAGRTYNHYLYDNEIDSYNQNHYQLHLTHRFSDQVNTSISYNFTKGKGFYEQYKEDENKSDYFSIAQNEDQSGDVIRRRWLDNDFHAVIHSLNYKNQNLELSWGGGYTWYIGNHYGEIIWSSFPTPLPIRTEYYRNKGVKTDVNTYVKVLYTLTPSLYAFGDVQYRNVQYKASGLSNDLNSIDVKNEYQFFNPKVGLTYTINAHNSAYVSFAVANREPNRDDVIKNPIPPQPEQLLDWEAGYHFTRQNFYAKANVYYMNYTNQLVLTGALDDVGDAIRENVAKSYRAGIELQTGFQWQEKLRMNVNATISQNKIKQYQYLIYDTQYDPNTWETVSYSAVSKALENTDISFSPRLILGSSVEVKPMNNLMVALITKYVGQQYLDNTANEAKKIDSYSVSNLNLSYQINPSWINNITFNVLINNVFNHEYESNGYTYSYYYRPQHANDAPITENFYYPQAGIHFLTGITVEF